MQTTVVLEACTILSPTVTNRSYRYLHMTLQLMQMPQNIIDTDDYFKTGVDVVI